MAQKKMNNVPKKGIPVGVQMSNVKNFFEMYVQKGVYLAPVNQRQTKASAKKTEEFFASMLAFSLLGMKETASAPLKGFTKVCDGHALVMYFLQGSQDYPVVEDGLHRIQYLLKILGNQVVVPATSPNAKVQTFIEPYIGLRFNQLPVEIQNAFWGTPILAQVVHTDDETIGQMLFYAANCGTNMKTDENVHNNFCDTLLYQEIQNVVEQVVSKDSSDIFPYVFKAGQRDALRDAFKKKALQDTIVRFLMRNREDWSDNSAELATALFYTKWVNNEKEVHKQVQRAVTALAKASYILGKSCPLPVYMAMADIMDGGKYVDLSKFMNKRAANQRNELGICLKKHLADVTLNGLGKETTYSNFLGNTYKAYSRYEKAHEVLRVTFKDMGVI